MEEQCGEVDQYEQPAKCPGTNHRRGSLPVGGSEEKYKTTDDGDI